MRIEYHPAVEQDVVEALQRYNVVSRRLGEEFKAELRRIIAVAAAKPERFHRVKPGFRRANLNRFPYHLIYCQLADGIRVTLVRHHRRDPSLGIERE